MPLKFGDPCLGGVKEISNDDVDKNHHHQYRCQPRNRFSNPAAKAINIFDGSHDSNESKEKLWKKIGDLVDTERSKRYK